jgi:sporulation protein YlmC with PRC-barrel domain
MIVEGKMLKRLLITAAASAVLIGTAIAQEPQSGAPESSATSGLGTTQEQFVMQQTADQFLASKFKGTDVIDSKNERIGSVNDVLFDKDGKIVAYVVGVGGFLGIGAKDVALKPSAFEMQPVTDEAMKKLKLTMMSKDDLKAMSEFKTYQEPRASTVGQGSPTTRMAPNGATAPGIPPAPRQ